MAFQTIGKSLPRKEGISKVTGKAIYADDISLADCLHGKTVRSTVPHGYIKAIRFKNDIDWSEFTVVLPSDIPGKNAVTLIDTDQPFLAEHEIRHIAEPVALIAHADKHALEKALQCIHIEVEELPAVFTMEDARDVFKAINLQNGDPDLKWAEADFILEETYRTGAQEHLYIEPQAMIATTTPGEQVTVMGSMQCPYYVQKALAPLFDLDPENIRIVQTETGGGFGGKEEYPNMIAGHAALLSWKAGGRPVKMIYSRHEDMWATTKRHPSKTRIKAGFKRDGTLIALDIDLTLDGGAYPTLSSVVLSRATLHSWGPYKCDRTRVRSRVVMTNSVPYGAFRGFGAPQAIYAIETHMSRAAHELGIDPAELRRKNFLHQGDRLPTGQIIKETINLEMLMDRALELSEYRQKRRAFDLSNEAAKESNERRKGIGLAVFFHGSGFTGSGEVRLASEVALALTGRGGVEVFAANVEYGQGTNTVLTQIAAETCGIAPELVDIHQPDTAAVPNSGPTVASRTTMIVGKLVERAALEMRKRLMEPRDFRKAALEFLSQHGELKVTVQYEAPTDIQWDDQTYRGEAYSGYAWSCDVAEVELDSVEYVARATKITSVVECGRVINPALAAGQIEGGIAQGVGFALYEDVVLDRGAMKNTQFTNYIIPTSADTPKIQVEFIEFPPSNPGPYQAKGIGEMPIDGPAPAIAAAVAQASGGRFINELPLLPEKLMREMESL